ncbi:acyltransferase domain-containing protein, partial [Streptomyces heilongjiangensis]
SEDEVLPLLDPVRVGIAAVNGPRSVVVSGEAGAVEEIADRFRADGRKVTALRVSHAFHSPLMEPMLAEFRAVAQELTYGQPSVPLVSTVTGEIASATELADPEYWVGHVRRPVRFADAVREAEATWWVELGADGTLSALAEACLDAAESAEGDARDRLVAPTLRRGRPEADSVLATAAELFTRGVPVRWAAALTAASPAVDPAAGAKAVDLPTYAFRRDRFWPANSPRSTRDLGLVGLGAAGHPLLGAAVELAGGDGV